MEATMFRHTTCNFRFAALVAVIASITILSLYSVKLLGQTQHSFSDIEKRVKRFESPERDSWQKPKEIIKALGLQPGDVVADIGAGTGYFTRLFAEAVGSEGLALGLDIEPDMVEFMKNDAERLGRKNYVPRLVKSDDPGLEPGSVDLIFLCDTYHHITNRVAYLKKLVNALRPDGRVVIVDFHKNMDTPMGPPESMKLARDTVIHEFQTAGYKLIREHTFLQYQYFLEFQPIRNTAAAGLF